MKICFFGSFERNYSKNVVLLKGLNNLGIEVVFCHHPNYFTFSHYPSLLYQFIKKGMKTDVIYVAFYGPYDVWFAYIIGKLFNKIVVYDPLVSIYNTRIEDRKYFSPDSWRAKFYIWFDYMTVVLSDLVVMDTMTHYKYWNRMFGLKKNKTLLVRVGADETVLIPKKIKPGKKLKLLFYGSYQPSQGALNIIQTAKILKNENLDWILIGNGQQREEVQQFAIDNKLTQVKFLDFMSFQELSNYINKADIVFGALGTTIKTNMVIHNKIFQGIAMGKVVVTADTDAVKEIAVDNKNIILVKSDPKIISQRIKRLINDRKKIDKISQEARQVFLDNFTTTKVAQSLIDQLSKYLKK